jgi:hypothetical protein
VSGSGYRRAARGPPEGFYEGSWRDEVKSEDVYKVHYVAEALYDISAGRRLTREGLERDVRLLMRCLRFDLGANIEAGRVLDRMLARADYWFGLGPICRIVVDEARRGDLRSPPRGPRRAA